MELSGYRETLAFIVEMFPRRLTLKVKEVAEVMSVCENTIRQAISKKDNPLPSQKLVSGTIVVPVPQLARWLSKERRQYGR